jgi:hypothetical protein
MSADRRGDSGRIARVVVGSRPENFAGLGVEGDDAGLRSADVGDDAPILDERRSGGAEVPLRYRERRRREQRSGARPQMTRVVAVLVANL